MFNYLFSLFFVRLIRLADSLMKNKSSFIYGESPSVVPIYAVVSMCSADGDVNNKNGEIEKVATQIED